ncbi:lamin tail domain-containing protein [Candidatus Aenigmatarchaeota archaeon]
MEWKYSLLVILFLLFVSGCTQSTGNTVNDDNVIDNTNNVIDEDYDQIVDDDQDIDNTDIEENIDECENIQCPNSFEICPDDFVSSCENICVDGQCSECGPDCSDHDVDVCEDVVCFDSELECLDGYIASCENICVDEYCTTCTPDCSEHTILEEACENECDNEGATCSESNRVVCANVDDDECLEEVFFDCEFGCEDGDCLEEINQTQNETIDHIVFSKVYYDPLGSEWDEEWVEIYNPTENGVDLTGWKIYDNSASPWGFDEGVVINPNDYLIIARDLVAFQNLYDCDPDFDSFTKALHNDGDQLILKDDENQEIDFVAWENYVENWDINADGGYVIKRTEWYDTDTFDDWESNQDPVPNC